MELLIWITAALSAFGAVSLIFMMGLGAREVGESALGGIVTACGMLIMTAVRSAIGGLIAGFVIEFFWHPIDEYWHWSLVALLIDIATLGLGQLIALMMLARGEFPPRD